MKNKKVLLAALMLSMLCWIQLSAVQVGVDSKTGLRQETMDDGTVIKFYGNQELSEQGPGGNGSNSTVSHFDPQGNLSYVTDATSGLVIETFTYDPKTGARVKADQLGQNGKPGSTTFYFPSGTNIQVADATDKTTGNAIHFNSLADYNAYLAANFPGASVNVDANGMPVITSPDAGITGDVPGCTITIGAAALTGLSQGQVADRLFGGHGDMAMAAAARLMDEIGSTGTAQLTLGNKTNAENAQKPQLGEIDTLTDPNTTQADPNGGPDITLTHTHTEALTKTGGNTWDASQGVGAFCVVKVDIQNAGTTTNGITMDTFHPFTPSAAGVVPTGLNKAGQANVTINGTVRGTTVIDGKTYIVMDNCSVDFGGGPNAGGNGTTIYVALPDGANAADYQPGGDMNGGTMSVTGRVTLDPSGQGRHMMTDMGNNGLHPYAAAGFSSSYLTDMATNYANGLGKLDMSMWESGWNTLAITSANDF